MGTLRPTPFTCHRELRSIFAPPVHYAANIYPDPHTYNPWRFVNTTAAIAVNSAPPNSSIKKDDQATQFATATEPMPPLPPPGPQIASPSRELFAFSYERHAW